MGITATARVTVDGERAGWCVVCGYPLDGVSGRGTELCRACLYLALFRERYGKDSRFLPGRVRSRSVKVSAGLRRLELDSA